MMPVADAPIIEAANFHESRTHVAETPSFTLPGLLAALDGLPSTDIRGSTHFRTFVDFARLNKEATLACISRTFQVSYESLHLFHALLIEVPGPWPALALIRCHAQLCRPIAETTDVKYSDRLHVLVRETTSLVKGSFFSVPDLIRCDPCPALRTSDGGGFITHKELRNLASNFCLPALPGTTRPVVAIALPNGPLLAAVCIAVATSYTAAPVNPAAGRGQFLRDVRQINARFVLTTASVYENLRLEDSIGDLTDVQILCIEWLGGGRIKLVTTSGDTVYGNGKPRPNQADDIALVLFTSGTSGTKKVVPATLHSLMVGVVYVVDSWGLTSNDVCVNMMPLYHIGGLMRNILAPLFAGGSTVCCPAFEPNLFWDVVEQARPTWYYASPSMHALILGLAQERLAALERCRIRLVCNAAGNLLPSLARRLRTTFDCVVLPSYGMTECMPITTPPLNYPLDREGTSGVSIGPDLSILDSLDVAVPAGTVGRICVRGTPVFPGYLLPDGSLDKSPFTAGGWFDTGDVGRVDTEGYLYITGRSKEVINRGGELISPFEVENAIMSAALSAESAISGRITQALAFPAAHDVLQEVVAVALVTPTETPRVDLRSLRLALRHSLQQAKWPALIVYMNDVPRKGTKVLRIQMWERLGLPTVSDDMEYLQRHWQASCPPPDTPICVSIRASPVSLDARLVSDALTALVPAGFRHHHCSEHNGMDIFVAPTHGRPGDPSQPAIVNLRERMLRCLHNYMVPERIYITSKPLPEDGYGRVDEGELRRVLDEGVGQSGETLNESTQDRVARIFADLLALAPDSVPPDVDFFSLGGDSLRAGRLISALRSSFRIRVPVALIFNHGTVRTISTHLDREEEAQAMSVDTGKHSSVEGCATTKSSTRPWLMALQLMPLAIAYPMRRAFQWTVFITSLSLTQQWSINDSVVGRLATLTMCILCSRVVTRCVAPCVGIASKWLIIGRYREGLYPMWGCYHTRWWVVDKIVAICGEGLFDTNDFTRRAYCRLMGATIGSKVKLAGAALGEWDLLDIRDGAQLSRCVCRPFAVEANTSMYLGRIVLGERSAIGVASIVAPGTEVPPNTCIGPNSSSWEMEDADEGYRELAPDRAPRPHWPLTVFLTLPLRLVAWFLSLLPWAAGLVGMVLEEPRNNDTPLRDILDWFTAADRVGYHYLALLLRTFLSPLVLFGAAVIVRVTLDAIFGKHGPIPTGIKGGGPVATWRSAVMKTLMPVSRLHDVTALFGQHYEATSVALRLLGAKVGKHVYWPGTGPEIGDYHLLDVGSDVVFGSRAHIITSDGLGSARVTISNGAMIADRVCLLPGVHIGEKTTMGSGSLTKRGQTYEDGGTFVGSQGGDALRLSTTRTAAGAPTQRLRKSVRRMSSEKTLAGVGEPSTLPKSEATRAEQPRRVHHMSSDETLAEPPAPSWALPGHREQTAADVDAESPAADSASPFGRAFYLGLAPYRVLGPVSIFCYSALMVMLTAAYWNVPSVASIQAVDRIMNQVIRRDASFLAEVVIVYGMMTAVMAVLTVLQAALALAVVVAAKWLLLGRRQPGNYDWDRSSYCQRWQLYLCIERLRRACCRGHGVLGLLTGTQWIVLYFRVLGAKIGKNCALFANGRPSLMLTEPDLVTLGDRVAVDDASIVAHINTRGRFDLNRLEVGSRCVLRSGSRLLSGATMKADSCLLEHTLVMGGDVVEERSTMQGWPAERFTGSRIRRGAHG